MRRRLPLALLVPAILIAAALAVPALIADRAAAAPLAPAAGCGDLLDYFREAARDRLGLWYGEVAEESEESEEEASSAVVMPAAVASADEASAAEAEAAAPADLGERSETGTNVQVAGVDESDIIKTAGGYIYILADDRLRVARIVPGGAEFAAALDLRDPFAPEMQRRELLLFRDRLLAFRSTGPAWDYWHGGAERTQIIEIDIADPRRPRLLRTLDTYGSFNAARLVGGSARVVLQRDAARDVLWRRAEEARWRDGWTDGLQLGEWLPIYSLTDHNDGTWRYGYTVECGDIHLPSDPTALGTTLLLTFDLAGGDGIGDWAGAGVVASDATVYATPDSFYIAAFAYPDTDVHRFDLSRPAEPRYAGSASVSGQLINQFAMSEYKGHLRVAATLVDAWPSVSELTVFRVGADGLEQAGKAGGLGTTETIYSVRFLGERGYVVTFRQIDPLYVLDLSDPAAPTVAGELKIPGYSRYLHPLSQGLLLGVGQDADPRTGRPLGLQVSLFDVSDPSAPAQLDRLELGDAESAAEFDHRAFTYDGTAYIPAGPSSNQWWVEPGDESEIGGALYAISVEPDALALEATLRFSSPPLRSLPIRNRLYVLTGEELATVERDDHELRQRLPY